MYTEKLPYQRLDGNQHINLLSVMPGSDIKNNMIFAKEEVQILRRLGINVDVFFMNWRTSPLQLLAQLKQYRSLLISKKINLIHVQYGSLHGFVFSILERMSQDIPQDELNRRENEWKVRLHTREYGLNDN